MRVWSAWLCFVKLLTYNAIVCLYRGGGAFGGANKGAGGTPSFGSGGGWVVYNVEIINSDSSYVFHTLNFDFCYYFTQTPRFGGGSTSFGGANKGNSGFGGGWVSTEIKYCMI